MNTRDVNLVNIGLMLLSALIAWSHPVELFLFAYAVLGPLHYLTEISWLHDRQWFSTSKRDWIMPTVVALAITLIYVAAEYWGQKPALAVEPVILGIRVRGGWVAYVGLLAIATSVAAAFARDGTRRAMLILAVMVAGFVLMQTLAGQLVVCVFLTTIVHVFVFTSCFILFGALKSKSLTGYLSWVVHLSLAALMLAVWSTEQVAMPPDAKDKLKAFTPVVAGINHVLSRVSNGPDGRAPVISCMRFIAFVYTYHYLNWFSKTGIIRWHQVSGRRLIALVATWIASLILYAWDWQWGFIALLALSVAHVLLEYPLNWKTFIGIGSELKARITRQPAAAS